MWPLEQIAGVEADHREAEIVDQAIWRSEVDAEVGQEPHKSVELAQALALNVETDPPRAADVKLAQALVQNANPEAVAPSG